MSGKSKEEVAFELLVKLKGVSNWGERNAPAILELYADCLDATNGIRKSQAPKSEAKPATTQAYAPVQATNAV